MVRIENISYSIAGRSLFENASATIPTGHKVGLIGRNGAGKTTLFRLISGEEIVSEGQITLPKRARLGGVNQEVPASETSLLDTVLASDTERHALLEEAERVTDAYRIAAIQTRLAEIDAWSAEARAAAILQGLGFSTAEQSEPCANFSGGWRMRVALAGVLFAQPDLLLLDEPTNYLDLEGALWLENYLAKYPHTVLIVSHDRGLLNRAVTGILHLENRTLTYYQGPYDQFAQQRAARHALMTAEAKKQEARRAHLQSFVDRFKAKATKAKQAQSRVKMLEKMTPINLPEDSHEIRFHFPQPVELSPPILRLEDAAAGYGGRDVLSKLDLRIDQDDRIALLGRNGQGKSTLSKILAGELTLTKGARFAAKKLKIGYFAQHQMDSLHADETPLDHLVRALPDIPPVKLRAKLASFGLGVAQAEVLVAKLSGGQKARLALLLATLDAPQLLILDEPTNHLDMESREALVDALTTYEGAVVLVSHDMHLLNLVADRLWLVQEGRVSQYTDDLEAYRLGLLGGAKETMKPKRQEQPTKAPDVQALKADVRQCEERIKKITDMHRKLQEKLSDPSLYEADRAQDLELWSRKYSEVSEGLERAEYLWMAALERLDAANT